MPYIRQGECNRCGECCISPFPKDWPDALRNHSFLKIVRLWPHAVLFGCIEPPGGGISRRPGMDFGTTLIPGGGPPKQFYWKFVEGHGYCKDTSADHNGTEHSLECPFLLDDPGDGTRPCGLVGTSREFAYTNWCHEGLDKSGSPPKVLGLKSMVDKWFENNPSCSYTYIEEVIEEE